MDTQYALYCLALRAFYHFHSKCNIVVDLCPPLRLQYVTIMEVEFENDDLDQLEVDPKFDAGFQPGVVKGFRKAMQAIRAAMDERDLRALRGLRLEKLKGKRDGQCSLRCNDQYRLIVTFEGQDQHKRVKIIEIVDYH